jgi:hypothetical protein
MLAGFRVRHRARPEEIMIGFFTSGASNRGVWGSARPPVTRRTTSAGARRVVMGAAAALLIGYLVLFHALLLWQRILDLTLFEPFPALRWLATVAVLGAILRLRRQGVSLTEGRQALVLWLLVLLLHVSLAVPAGEADPWSSRRSEAGLLLVLPAASVAIGLVARVLRLRWARRRVRARSPGSRPTSIVGDLRSFALLAGQVPALASRPPPVV